MTNVLKRILHYKKLLSLVTALVAISLPPARAQLNIEILGSDVRPINIYLSKLTGDYSLAQSLADIVAGDLTRSGSFQVTHGGVPQQLPPDQPAGRANDTEIAVDGSITVNGNTLQATVRLFDTVRNKPLGEKLFTAQNRDWRLLSHTVSDYIYEAVLGVPGVFSTQILYVLKRNSSHYELIIVDADGSNPHNVLTSSTPIISPAWDPQGKKIAYVSFENRRPVVYVQNLLTGERQVQSGFPGNNSGPTWSPDGNKMAVVLTKDGGSHIYQINANGSGEPQRLMRSSGIDTEPRYSPDGKFLYFTSDRGGSPQIYQLELASGTTKRLTFDGRYNVSPRPSPDGKSVAFISQDDESNFRLKVIDLSSGQIFPLTSSGQNEGPDYAPNGRFIVVANRSQNQLSLIVVSTVSTASYKLSSSGISVYDAAWGPMRKTP